MKTTDVPNGDQGSKTANRTTGYISCGDFVVAVYDFSRHICQIVDADTSDAVKKSISSKKKKKKKKLNVHLAGQTRQNLDPKERCHEQTRSIGAIWKEQEDAQAGK